MGRGATVRKQGILQGVAFGLVLAVSPWGFGAGAAAAEEPAPDVSLEKLLKLPDSYSLRSFDRTE